MRNREEMAVALVNYLQKIGLLMLLLVTGAYTNSAFAQETPKRLRRRQGEGGIGLSENPYRLQPGAAGCS